MLFKGKHWCLDFCILEMEINPSPASVSMTTWKEATDLTVTSRTPHVSKKIAKATRTVELRHICRPDYVTEPFF